MEQAQTSFRWHPDARLFSGSLEISRPIRPHHTSFKFINAASTAKALTCLGNVLGNRGGFCLSEGSANEPVTAPKNTFLTLTGGSSGTPKAILRTQASWIASFYVNADLFSFTIQDTVAVLGRLSHSLALYGVLEGLHLGLDVGILDMLPPSDQRNALRRRKTSVVYATPTQLRLLLGRSKVQLPDVRLVLCGGGSLDTATAQAVARHCPNADLRVFYGAAETSFITIADVDTPAGTVGRAYPGVRFELRGTDGEVWVKSPYLCERYADDTRTLQRDADGYMSIGELGECSDDGTLTIKGRKTRVVNIADQTVHLEAVEALIADFPAGGPCAVLARIDSMRGHRLIAIVEGPSDQMRAQHIKAHCQEKLGPMIAPKTVYFRDVLPKLASGKTDMHALNRWLEQQE